MSLEGGRKGEILQTRGHAEVSCSGVRQEKVEARRDFRGTERTQALKRTKKFE